MVGRPQDDRYEYYGNYKKRKKNFYIFLTWFSTLKNSRLDEESVKLIKQRALFWALRKEGIVNNVWQINAYKTVGYHNGERDLKTYIDWNSINIACYSMVHIEINVPLQLWQPNETNETLWVKCVVRFRQFIFDFCFCHVITNSKWSNYSENALDYGL